MECNFFQTLKFGYKQPNYLLSSLPHCYLGSQNVRIEFSAWFLLNYFLHVPFTRYRHKRHQQRSLPPNWNFGHGRGAINCTPILLDCTVLQKKSCLSQKGDLPSVVVIDIPNNPPLTDFSYHIRIVKFLALKFQSFTISVLFFHDEKFWNLYHK